MVDSYITSINFIDRTIAREFHVLKYKCEIHFVYTRMHKSQKSKEKYKTYCLISTKRISSDIKFYKKVSSYYRKNIFYIYIVIVNS